MHPATLPTTAAILVLLHALAAIFFRLHTPAQWVAFAEAQPRLARFIRPGGAVEHLLVDALERLGASAADQTTGPTSTPASATSRHPALTAEIDRAQVVAALLASLGGPTATGELKAAAAAVGPLPRSPDGHLILSPVMIDALAGHSEPPSSPSDVTLQPGVETPPDVAAAVEDARTTRDERGGR